MKAEVVEVASKNQLPSKVAMALQTNKNAIL
jgi:hypothetical protein